MQRNMTRNINKQASKVIRKNIKRASNPDNEQFYTSPTQTMLCDTLAC